MKKFKVTMSIIDYGPNNPMNDPKGITVKNLKKLIKQQLADAELDAKAIQVEVA